MSSSIERFRRYAWAVVVVNLLVIVWGAFVRASGSGAGCGDHWPTCNGDVLPHAESVETAIELTHRLTSGLALLLVVGSLVVSRRVFPAGHPNRRWATAAMVLMLVEAAVGAALVLLRLTGDDTSAARAFVIAVHLINTFLLVATLTLTAETAEATPPTPRPSGLFTAAGVGAFLLVVTGAAGAVTALGDTLFPSGSLAAGLEADLSPTAHFLVRLRVVHPALAGVSFLYLVGLVATATAARPALRDRGRVLGVALALQVGIGVADLLLLAPTWLQLVHVLFADLVWIALVRFAIGVATVEDGVPAAAPLAPAEEAR